VRGSVHPQAAGRLLVKSSIGLDKAVKQYSLMTKRMERWQRGYYFTNSKKIRYILDAAISPSHHNVVATEWCLTRTLLASPDITKTQPSSMTSFAAFSKPAAATMELSPTNALSSTVCDIMLSTALTLHVLPRGAAAPLQAASSASVVGPLSAPSVMGSKNSSSPALTAAGASSCGQCPASSSCTRTLSGHARRSASARPAMK